MNAVMGSRDLSLPLPIGSNPVPTLLSRSPGFPSSESQLTMLVLDYYHSFNSLFKQKS